jgi:hypothetical protein
LKVFKRCVILEYEKEASNEVRVYIKSQEKKKLKIIREDDNLIEDKTHRKRLKEELL